MKTIRIAAAAMLLAVTAGAAPAAAQQQEPIYEVRGDDPEMNAAMARAIGELPAFYARLANPGEGEIEYRVKFDILPGEGAEYVWAGDLDRSTTPMTGVLVNQPRFTDHRLGQRVPIPEADIIDWSYMRGGVMQGAYTQRVIVDRLEPAERARLRAMLGWDRVTS
jgi:uncharacterized protein YegJ (DUF2314 family)